MSTPTSKPLPKPKPKPNSTVNGPPKPKPKFHKAKKSWSMFPSLHPSVSVLLTANNLTFTFLPTDVDQGCIRDYDTNIKGRFRCVNRACPKSGWASKKIAITIRMYPGQRYNARVYHQRCKECEQLSQPVPDDSYAERVAYRLKKWSGIEMDLPFFNERGNNRPHHSDLCEGCKYGHCREGGRGWRGSDELL